MAHGHRVEKPFLREFFEITQRYDHHTSVSIKAVYSPGCVMHKSLIYLRDSSDGVVIYSRDEWSSYGARPMEVKSRFPQELFREKGQTLPGLEGCYLKMEVKIHTFIQETRQMIQFMLVFVRIARKVIRMTMRNPIGD